MSVPGESVQLAGPVGSKELSFFDLASPHPTFPHYSAYQNDQLPGRPREGVIPVEGLFNHLLLSTVLEIDQGGWVKGGGKKVFDELRRTNAPVLGSNLAAFLHKHQDIIPKSSQDTILVFPGTIYRGGLGDGAHIVTLSHRDKGWVMFPRLVEIDWWHEKAKVVLLKEEGIVSDPSSA